MYYRYKIKKKNTKVFKVLIISALICTCAFFIFKYRSYLMIWKYSHNKLVKKIETANSLPDVVQRRSKLNKLIVPFKNYREENPAQANAFILNGYVYYLIGTTYLPGNFTSLIINNLATSISSDAKNAFLKAIKYFRKGEALLHNESLEPQYAIQLAKSLFFCQYENPGSIYNLLHIYEDTLNNEARVRFYSFICVLHNQADKGIVLLKKNGGINKNIKTKLFLAITEKYAKHYTSSIKIFKEIIQQTKNKVYLKIAHTNLGEIFFNQSLYKEALFHYNTVLSIDDTHNESRIIIGKIYFAQGDKLNARKYWEQAFKWDKNNKEIEKLLATVKR